MLLDQLADRVSASIWNLHPGRAVAVGRHEYDGQVPDLSAPAVEAGLDRLGRLRAQLAALDCPDPEAALDRAVLLGVADGEQLDIEVLGRRRLDPGWYLEPLEPAVYLERDYAPAGLRLERAAALLGGAGGLLEAGRAHLAAVLPLGWAEGAVRSARARADRLVAQAAWAPDARAVPEEGARLREAAAYASGELERFAAWLEAERLPAAAGPGPGREELEAWLRVAESLFLTAEDVAGLGAARLAEDEEALAADAARLAPGLSPQEACRRAAAADVPADPVAALSSSLVEVQRRAAWQGLVCPEGLPALGAVAGPAVIGEEAGWLQAPGPYDDPATGARVLLAAGGPPGWGRAQLDELAVRAGWPGRLAAAAGAARAPGEARRRFAAAAFLEGWTLYAGDLMAEAGFREEAPGWRLLWRRRVAVASCRMAVLPRLWCGDLSPGQAASVFGRRAGLGSEAAEAEVRRSAEGPERLAGALGRAQILEWRRRGAGGGGPRPFHDALLAPGALPLGLLGSVVVS